MNEDAILPYCQEDLSRESILNLHARAGPQLYTRNKQGDPILRSGLKAGLHDRLIHMIALCGLIGPGVFVGMGTGLSQCGPAGLLAGFAISGILIVSVMNSIGEINSFLDLNFTALGALFVSEGFGATVGAYYTIIWISNIIAEYTSLTSALEEYTDTVPTYGWFLIFWGIFTLFQMLNVSWWGAFEYILGILKLTIMGGFYIFAIIYAAGGIKGHNPGNPFGEHPLRGGFDGIASSLSFAAVFYSGIEGISVLDAEARNPGKAIPKAVSISILRVFYVYFGLTIAYGITVSYTNPALAGSTGVLMSPMTIALTQAGWPGSKYLITTFIWLTCFSSINAAIYLSSRTVYTLAQRKYLPKVFTKTTQRGIPWVAIHTCHLFGFLSILSYSSGARVAYEYIVNINGVTCFIVWVSISIVHLRFRKSLRLQGFNKNILPYSAKLYPWATYLAIFIGVIMCFVQGYSCFRPWDYRQFIDSYILLPLFPIVWACYDLFYFKKGFVDCADVDVLSERRIDMDDEVGGDIVCLNNLKREQTLRRQRESRGSGSGHTNEFGDSGSSGNTTLH